MILVCAINVHQSCAGPEDIEYNPNEFFTAPTHDLIDNKVKEQRRISSNIGLPRKAEAITTLIPSNKSRKGSTANWRKQGRGCICDIPQKTTDICSV